MELLTWTLALTVVTLCVLHFLDFFTYWWRRGIPSAKGLRPFVGHLLPVFKLEMNMAEIIRKVYNENKEHSMVGMHHVMTPMLVVREPSLVKTIMQTQFTNFHENALKIDPKLDPLLSKNPFFSYGKIWQIGRKRLTYAFSNMRLKILFESVLGVTKKQDDYLKRKLGASDRYETELKDLFSRFTGEVVANAGMGVEGFCYDDNPKSASFQQIGKEFLDPNVSNGIIQALVFLVPQLGRVFGISFLPKKIDQFFRDIVNDVMESRRNESAPRNDFFQLMFDLEKTEGETLDPEILAAHTLSFFVDGYETSSITLSFIGYQLARHPEIQEKLREEITSTIEKHGGLTFESLKEMTYMDQVINESQRYYPALGNLLKVCTEEYELRGTDGLSCKMKPGMHIAIPIHGMQMDPKFFPDPERFDPDRFSGERKKDIDRFAFIPFGEGPRICVGMRMALLQIKVCLAALLKDYSLELSPKTKLPLKISGKHFLMAIEGGLWVYIKRL